MADNSITGSRIIQIRQNIIGPGKPKQKSIKQLGLNDFPGVPKVYLNAALKYSSPFFIGPPLCEELVGLVRHMFTEEEAAVFTHLKFKGKTSSQIAAAARMPPEAADPVLNRLAFEKRLIAATGPEQKRKFHKLPLMPGVFELCLIRPSIDSLTGWHRRFAELFEALYETGYTADYHDGSSASFIRYLPVNRVISAHPMALPTDKLEVILDRYKSFGVGLCQCRLAMDLTGRGCGKPKLNCAIMGEKADSSAVSSTFKKVTKQEMLEIKLEAESNGMVNWMLNVENTKIQSSCSCCGCCCHNFRTITEFNAPSSIAPPHFLPKVDFSKCNYCGKCAKNCPMAAITVNTKDKTYLHLDERCIGCGLCAVSCNKNKAVAMEPVPEYKLPYKSWFALISRWVPENLLHAYKIKLKRKRL